MNLKVEINGLSEEGFSYIMESLSTLGAKKIVDGNQVSSPKCKSISIHYNERNEISEDTEEYEKDFE